MKDRLGRRIDYIRISVTDRCNLRCCYCMPSSGIETVSHGEILSFDEIARLAEIFARAGIKHIKLTGGEPLVRKGFTSLVRSLKQTKGIESVTMTTNGILLEENLPELAEAGIDGINISLDTLDRERYKAITGTDGLNKVIGAVDACSRYPDIKTKINAVTLADYNRDEICSLAALAVDRNVDVRFIEMMPLGLGAGFRGYGQDDILAELAERFGTPEKVNKALGSGPAVYYHFPGHLGNVGFISALTHKFCSDCNRIRLTSQGILKPCLQYDTGGDLRASMRGGADDDEILRMIENTIYNKPSGHEFTHAVIEEREEKFMSEIGG